MVAIIGVLTFSNTIVASYARYHHRRTLAELNNTSGRTQPSGVVVAPHQGIWNCWRYILAFLLLWIVLSENKTCCEVGGNLLTTLLSELDEI